jgi:transposase
MLTDLLQSVNKIYIAYGVTDFRKQIPSLCSIVRDNFKTNPYNKSAYIFCNKKRNSIKVLCYDKNGFILAQKTLLDTEKMKFQWPRNSSELRNISKQQLNWLLSGLKIEQKNSFKEIEINLENTAN